MLSKYAIDKKLFTFILQHLRNFHDFSFSKSGQSHWNKTEIDQNAKFQHKKCKNLRKRAKSGSKRGKSAKKIKKAAVNG